MNLLFLSRLQFATTVAFHYLFPPLTIGLGVLMVVVEGLSLKTRDPAYESIARFWTRLFAVNFAMGVATGIVMEFEFGTNWAIYSRFVGDVFGSALAAEGIFAFFLESGFLGVLLFGWDRVSRRMHFFSTCMVSLGGIFSSIWIVVANSFMQTPAGYHLVRHDGHMRAEIVNFWAVVFNPSSVERLVHVLLGAFVLGGFFAMSIAAWYLLQGRHVELARRMLVISLWFAAISSTLILFSGDSNARMVAHYQPPKLAAFEGHFTTGHGPTPLYLFGIPDENARTVHLGIAVPGMLSFLVYHNFKHPVEGLDQVPRDDWPPVAICFVSFHVMVALGCYFIALTWLCLILLKRGRLFECRPVLWLLVVSVLAAYAANELGWVAAEVGRQPWIVYGLLKTSNALSPNVHAQQVLWSLIAFGFVYLMLFLVWVFVTNDKIQHGPDVPGPPHREEDFTAAVVESVAERGL